jgi:glycosyltransferase involved in cell wall biosynthesis
MDKVQSKLAIIIPAFKSIFLKQALDSISNQSCKDFTLYIGDDASKEDIIGIVRKYEKKINIVYHCFDKNFGEENLTKQWNRCVSLSTDEPYIWLFSDDDEMSANAVSCFYQEIEKSDDYDLYRFDLSIINEKSDVIKEFIYPDLQDRKDFFISRIHESLYSCVTQYIFKRSAYNSSNGFVSFPLAWFSDDASMIKFALENNGIKKISGAVVKWRFAEEINITTSKRFENKKVRAVFEYALWFNNYLGGYFSRDEMKKLTRIFLSKRLLKMKLSEYFRFANIESVFKVSGLIGGLYLFFYITYCRLKTKGNS